VWAPHGPFNNASLLVKHDELYQLFITDYPYCEKLMNFASERILDCTKAMDEAGADVLCVGGNVPGGFLGKKNYDQYILPFERKYIEFCQQRGTPAMYHNQNGTLDQIREVTKKTMLIGKPGGKFITQSVDFPEYGTPIENLRTYVSTTLEYAWYWRFWDDARFRLAANT
jgi:uroporphyrinogen-III decarboxylase